MRSETLAGTASLFDPPLVRRILFLAMMMCMDRVRVAEGAESVDLEVEAYPEGVRCDLRTGRFFEASEPSAGAVEAPPRFSVHPLALRALRDEVVSFQVVLRGRSATYDVSVRGFTDPSGTRSGVRADLFFERGIDVREPSMSPKVHSLGPGFYPDALIPTTTVTVPERPGVAILWVDLHVPRSARPGKHRGCLSFAGAGRALSAPERCGGDEVGLEVDLEIDVLGLSMPKRDVARLGAVSFGSFLAREKIDPRLMLRWMQLAHAHYVTVELMRPTPDLGPGGEIDWNGWAERVGPYVDGSAFSARLGYAGPREELPATRFVAPHAEWWPSPATPEQLPSDEEGWSRTLRSWERFVEEKGWFDLPRRTEWVMFINGLDEPKTAEKLVAIQSYGPLLEAAKLSDRRRIAFRVDGVLGARIEGWSDERKVKDLSPIVDLWNLHGASDTAPLALLRNVPQDRVMFYASNSSGEPAIPPLVVDSAITGARAWGWIVSRYGLAGALNWEVDFAAGCVENPRCSEGGALNLDALLIYRGEEVGRGAHEPIPSMRLKALRRGAQDAALLALLEERDAGAARALREIVVPRALGDGLPREGRGKWPLDPWVFERARDAILDRLAGLRGPMPIAAVRSDTEESAKMGFGLLVKASGALILIWALLRAQRRRSRG